MTGWIARRRERPLSVLMTWAFRSTLFVTMVLVVVSIVSGELGIAAAAGGAIGFGFLVQPEHHRRQVIGRA